MRYELLTYRGNKPPAHRLSALYALALIDKDWAVDSFELTSKGGYINIRSRQRELIEHQIPLLYFFQEVNPRETLAGVRDGRWRCTPGPALKKWSPTKRLLAYQILNFIYIELDGIQGLVDKQGGVE